MPVTFLVGFNPQHFAADTMSTPDDSEKATSFCVEPRRSNEASATAQSSLAGVDEGSSTSSSQPRELPLAPHVFSRANRVVVEGSNTFSNAAGSVFHINNLHLPVVTAAGTRDARSADTGGRDSNADSLPDSPSTVNGPLDMLHVKPSTNPQHESEVYARLLLPKKYGYPLWYPAPRRTLPIEYVEKGINIGDVGLITAEGGFDFLFNICLPADHPVNGGFVPEGFRPISINESRDMDVNPLAWRPGSHIANGSVRIMDPMSTSEFIDRYSFECSSANGAILTLPEGALRANLLSLNEFYRYAGKNAYSWYKFVNGPRGRQAVNGSLYLITGYDKTRSWGTASFDSVTGSGKFDLNFNASQSNNRRCANFAYVWSRSGLATTSEGPLLEHPPDRRERPQNQSTFIRGYRIALGETLWSLLVHTVDVTPIIEQQLATFFTKSTFVPFGLNNAVWDKMLDHSLAYGESPSPPTTSNGFESTHQAHRVFLKSDIPTIKDQHPSDAINRFLLEKCPTADVAITHDDLWCSVILEGEGTMPDPSVLMRRICDSCDLESNSGIVAFSTRKSNETKDNPNPEPVREVDDNLTWSVRRTPQAAGPAMDQLRFKQAIRFLSSTGDINSRDPKGRTPIALAAEGGLDTILSALLLTPGVNVESQTRNGRTPLSLAAEKGHFSIVRILLNHPDVDPNSADFRGWTPLAFAAYHGHKNTVSLLLVLKQFIVDLPNSFRRTPLMHAAKNGHHAVVDLLLNLGRANPNLQDLDGATALSLGASHGHLAVVEALLASRRVEVNHRDSDGYTPLLSAVVNGHTAVVRTLINTGKVDLDAKNASHQTPLLLAAKSGFVVIVDLLLAQQVEIDCQDYDHRTPLSYAAEEGRVQIVESLLRRQGVNPDSTNQWNGWTPLFYAVDSGHIAIVETLLLCPGVDANRQDFLDRTPLALAAEKGNETIVEMLIRHENIRMTSPDIWGREPISYATQEGHATVVAILRDRIDGKEILTDASGQTTFKYAQASGKDSTPALFEDNEKIDLM